MSLSLSQPAVAGRADHARHNGSPRPADVVPRLSWSGGRKRLMVAFHGHDVRLELDLGGHRALSGPWTWRLRVDGRMAEPIGNWEETCRLAQRRAVYLELAIPLTHQRRLERHVFLAPRDGFLLLADAILGESPARIEYTTSLPLVRSARFEPAEESHEGWLATDCRRSAVLPLGLPEWRSGPRVGSLAASVGAIELRQSAYGNCHFAPLFIDLKRKRLGKPLTWRRLTVAEQRRIQPADRAVGYRVQIGRKQWLIYRSLAPATNRTVLGKNLCTEFLVARFDKNGDCDTLLEIE